MKKYHECAVAINYDTGKPDFFFVKNGTLTEGYDWRLCNRAEFENMVKSGEVQYLKWDDKKGVPYAEYTEEDLAEMKAATKGVMKVNNIYEKQESYFEIDLRFNAAHLDKALSMTGEPVLAGSLAKVTKTFGMTNSLIFLAGNPFNINAFMLKLSEYQPLLGTDLSKLFKAAGKYACYAQIPDIILDKVLEVLSPDILFDTSTARNSLKYNAVKVKSLFVKDAKAEVVEKIADKLDAYTKEKMLDLSIEQNRPEGECRPDDFEAPDDLDDYGR